eukprot:Skav209597  [mRNA]  locus=scaffold1607:336680:338509:- [translate_table: standard]
MTSDSPFDGATVPPETNAWYVRSEEIYLQKSYSEASADRCSLFPCPSRSWLNCEIVVLLRPLTSDLLTAVQTASRHESCSTEG